MATHERNAHNRLKHRGSGLGEGSSAGGHRQLALNRGERQTHAGLPLEMWCTNTHTPTNFGGARILSHQSSFSVAPMPGPLLSGLLLTWVVTRRSLAASQPRDRPLPSVRQWCIIWPSFPAVRWGREAVERCARLPTSGGARTPSKGVPAEQLLCLPSKPDWTGWGAGLHLAQAGLGCDDSVVAGRVNN